METVDEQVERVGYDDRLRLEVAVLREVGEQRIE